MPLTDQPNIKKNCKGAILISNIDVRRNTKMQIQLATTKGKEVLRCAFYWVPAIH